MEESVALDSSNQKKFVKSIRGIKKLIKKTGKVPKPDKTINPSPKTKKRRTLRKRGLVYLSHIPHGFYEHEMTEYFKQFGKVTNCRVIRSKKTGASKGFAFIEFSEPAVAQIVAETMNNYLMGKRLLKAECIPPEKQRRHAMRKNWNQQNNPGNNLKLRLKKAFNETKTDEQDLKKARKILTNLNQTKKKLMAAGIDYDFFLPVDVPQELADKVEVKSEPAAEKPKDAVTKDVKTKETKVKEVKSKDTKVAQKAKEVSVKPNEKESKKASKEKETKKVTKEDKTKDTKAGQKALGVKKPLESFIKVGESDSDGDSDGSLVFDSDEFEQLQEFDEEFESGDEASGSEDDDEGSEEESSEDESPPPAKKAATNKKGAKPAPKPQPKKEKAPKSKPEVKRKAPQNAAVNSSKKQKFEKKATQPKIFKKK